MMEESDSLESLLHSEGKRDNGYTGSENEWDRLFSEACSPLPPEKRCTDDRNQTDEYSEDGRNRGRGVPAE